MADSSPATYRPLTPAENLRVLASRLSEHLSPAERREIEEAASLLSERGDTPKVTIGVCEHGYTPCAICSANRVEPVDRNAIIEECIAKIRRIQSWHRNPDVVLVLDDCINDLKNPAPQDDTKEKTLAGHQDADVPPPSRTCLRGNAGTLPESPAAAGPAPVSAIQPIAWIWHYSDGHRSLRWRPDYDPCSTDVPNSVTPLYLEAQRSATLPIPDYKALYHELIYQVGNKWPGETRHQTALRYLRQAESNSDNRASSDRTGADHG